MGDYNYRQAMISDIRDYFLENYTMEEIRENMENRSAWEEKLYDDLWADDSVTGNGSGSYTFNRLKARDYVIDNISLCIEGIQEFCVDTATIGEKFLEEDWEYLDVTIRCYLLGEVLHSVLDEIEVELEETRELLGDIK